MENRLNYLRLSETETQTRFEKLCMCSVTERYALFYSWGFPQNFISNLDLTGTPLACFIDVLELLYTRDPDGTGLATKFYESLLMAKLPPGIPEE